MKIINTYIIPFKHVNGNVEVCKLHELENAPNWCVECKTGYIFIYDHEARQYL